MTDQTRERFSTSVGPEAGPIIAGEVLGHGLFRMSPGDVPALRRRPGPIPDGWGDVAPSLLRYSDEQTIAGTAAVFTAIESMGVSRDGFEGWGVVAASRYLGRANLALALRSFVAEGVWGTSPHLIPHFALHSPAGTISLALGLHGPNVGVGGGLHAAAEGFLAALTWVSAGGMPGVWLVLSGWSPELVPDRHGNGPAAGECQALAIALVAGGIAGRRPRVRAVVGAEAHHAAAPIDLVRLAERLECRGERLPRTIATDPMGRLRIELVDKANGLG
ncbi:MAG: hypothetical protein ACHRXM_00640 [Isosphaerales bacterium]